MLAPADAAMLGLIPPSAGHVSLMPRVKIGPALPDRETAAVEIARLRDLDIGELRNRWHTVFGRRPPSHLPRHLLFRVLAYRLQTDHFGDLDGECQRLLDRSESPEEAGQRTAAHRHVTHRMLLPCRPVPSFQTVRRPAGGLV